MKTIALGLAGMEFTSSWLGSAPRKDNIKLTLVKSSSYVHKAQRQPG